jgi:hypothetical protein
MGLERPLYEEFAAGEEDNLVEFGSHHRITILPSRNSTLQPIVSRSLQDR